MLIQPSKKKEIRTDVSRLDGEEWLERRFKVMAKKKKELGQEIVLADIRREMRLKPNTYKKYASFIEDLLKELNG